MLQMTKLEIIEDSNIISGCQNLLGRKRKRGNSEKYRISPSVEFNTAYIDGYTINIHENTSFEFFKILLDAHNIEIDSEKLYGIPADLMEGGSNLVKIRKDPIISKIPNRFFYQIFKEKHVQTLKDIFEYQSFDQQTLKFLLELSVRSYSIEMVEFILQHCPFDVVDKRNIIPHLKKSDNLEFIEYILEKLYQVRFDRKKIFEVITPSYESLYKHAELDHIDIIRFFVENGIDPSNRKYLVLETAIRHSSFETAKYFLLQVSINNISENAILAGMKSKNPDFVKLLIDHGANVNVKSGAALYYGCLKGATEYVSSLIQNGADVYIDNSKALQKAVDKNYSDIVELILKNSVRPHEIIKTIFVGVCIRGHYNLVKLFIKYNQVPKNFLGEALYYALFYRNTVIYELLLENGADYNVKSGKMLEMAAQREDKTFMDILLSKKDIQISNNSRSLFIYGCKYGKVDLVEKHINSKSRCFFRNLKGGLLVALENGQERISKMLISEINDLKEVGNKALVFACKNGYFDIVQKLCDSNEVDVNMYEGDAYFNSVSGGFQKISSCLIKAGLNMGYIDMGKIAEACRNGDNERITELVQTKDINISFKNDLCLKLACGRGHLETVRLILRLKNE
ncbi:hypothetical protein BB558_000515 [Smittium angustum]|uniref:Uncharacterized protein n=1 Tax=Smittium angustum TaxID=133377 RepID=A0A2U1JE20_SMIAN|nr:hypothetical protein BB558_000515 [Smittium angustum]